MCTYTAPAATSPPPGASAAPAASSPVNQLSKSAKFAYIPPAATSSIVSVASAASSSLLNSTHFEYLFIYLYVQ